MKSSSATLIKTKSSKSGPSTQVYDSMLHMRLEEAYAQIRQQQNRRENENEPLFADVNQEEFIVVKQMFKELEQFAGLQPITLLQVSWQQRLSQGFSTLNLAHKSGRAHGGNKGFCARPHEQLLHHCQWRSRGHNRRNLESR